MESECLLCGGDEVVDEAAAGGGVECWVRELQVLVAVETGMQVVSVRKNRQRVNRRGHGERRDRVRDGGTRKEIKTGVWKRISKDQASRWKCGHEWLGAVVEELSVQDKSSTASGVTVRAAAIVVEASTSVQQP